MNSQLAITIDVDWAPDFAIAKIAAILVAKRVKATWFLTHDSPEVQKLATYSELFELGIHPNFYGGSTHGNTPKTVFEHLLQLVPQARSMRSHGLFQSSQIMRMAQESFGIHNDVSIFLPYTDNIQPHRMYYSRGTPGLIRLPYFWEDGEEMLIPNPNFELNGYCQRRSGLKIFNFHPIHVALNSRALQPYEQLKQRVNLNQCEAGAIVNYIEPGVGTQTFFIELVEHLAKQGESFTISELALYWNNFA